MKETLNDTMMGKICLVTGATNGIGKATAQALAQMSATVVIVGRNPAKCAAVVSEIKHSSGNDAVEARIADLSIMAEVQHVADQFKAKYQQLHVLVNNAGGAFLKRQVTAEGFEKTFALNHLNSFLLTSLLLDTLKASAPARIVNVSSAGQAPINFLDVMLEQNYDGVQAYCQSKLALVMFTFDLAEELAGTGVTANCLHPATYMPTKMVLAARGSSVSTIEEGVQATTHLITAPELDQISGCYFNGLREARAESQAYDRQARRQLRQLSEQLTGLTGS